MSLLCRAVSMLGMGGLLGVFSAGGLTWKLRRRSNRVVSDVHNFRSLAKQMYGTLLAIQGGQETGSVQTQEVL